MMHELKKLLNDVQTRVPPGSIPSAGMSGGGGDAARLAAAMEARTYALPLGHEVATCSCPRRAPT